MNEDLQLRHPVELLAEEYSVCLRSGASPSLEEYVARYPQHEHAIRAVFPPIAILERANQKHQSARLLPGWLPYQRKSLGDFRIVREVARGGMGIVYEAVQQSLNRRVALKVLAPNSGESSKLWQRFATEAEAAAKLHHTNIVPVFATGIEDGVYYYAMQFIDGIPLSLLTDASSELSEATKDSPAAKDVLARLGYPLPSGGRSAVRSAPPYSKNASAEASSTRRQVDTPVSRPELPAEHDLIAGRPSYWQNIARLVAEIADALGYAHQHGVLHRDVKPSNLLLDKEGRIWITDFGLAKQDGRASITDSGKFVGTLRYMAPEQFNGRADSRSDVYGLGLTLFELLTFRPAFEESRHGPLIKERTGELPRLPRTVNTEIPRDLETITLKACATDSAHRYQTAEEMADDLRRFLADRPILARRTGRVERAWRWARRNPSVATLSGVTFLLLATIAGVAEVGNYRTKQALEIAEREKNRAEQNLVLALQEKDRAREALSEVEREHRRAETNLGLSMQAFDQIVRNISERGVAQTLELDLDHEQSPASDSVLTTADAELLETLLAFFDRFARENSTDITRASAAARKCVAEIQQRLFRFEQAEETYRQALDSYIALADNNPRDPELLLVKVSILNELGIVSSRRGKVEDAAHWHTQALQLLETSPDARKSTAGRLELARTLSLYSSIGSRVTISNLAGRVRRESGRRYFSPTFRPPLRNDSGLIGDGPRPFSQGRAARDFALFRFTFKHLNELTDANQQAIELLLELLQEDPANRQYQLALARSYRDRTRLARLSREPILAAESLAAAVEILERLAGESPEWPEVKFELADALCTPPPSHFGPHGPRDPAPPQVERAVELCEELLASYPNMPEYQALAGSTLARLARLKEEEHDYEQAREMYLRSIESYQSLTRRFPSVLPYQFTMAQAEYELARVNQALARPQEARTRLTGTIKRLEDFAAQNDASMFFESLLQQLRERRDAIEL